MGGDISLTKSHLDGKVETSGGRVTIEDVTGSVKGHSMGGAVSYKNISAGSSSGDEVVISTMGGDIDVPSASNGADLMTMGGNITITSAKNHVKAKTMGGNIR